MERKLRVFTIVNNYTDNEGFEFSTSDRVTIQGVYEPSRWELLKERQWRRLLPVVAICHRLKWYFGNLWNAICGRSNEF